MNDSEEIESPVEFSERNWNRVIEAATKAGYREGVEEGKQTVFQQGFDIGYEDAFKTAFILGRFKGLVTAAAINEHPSPSPVDDILEKTRRGACCVCAKKSKTSNRAEDDFTEPPLQEVRDKQREHSAKLIGVLHRHFEKLLTDSGVQIDHVI